MAAEKVRRITIKGIDVNFGKLEDFLKKAFGGGHAEVILEYNNHKACYCTVEEYEKHYTNIKHHWVSEEEKQKAYLHNTMWSLSFLGSGAENFKSFDGSSIEAVLKAAGVTEEEIFTAGQELKALLDSLMVGEYTSGTLAYFSYAEIVYFKDGKEVEEKKSYKALLEEDPEVLDISEDDWVNPEEEKKAKELDQFWNLQWYPNTPVGFCRVYASNLPALIDSFKEN